MADNVAITAGSGTNVATDERTINSVTVQIQRTNPIGSSTGASGQVEISSTSATLLAARETRRSVVFVNRQPVPVFIDPSGGTAATTHGALYPNESITLAVTGAITARTTSAYTATGDAKVHYFETYDS